MALFSRKKPPPASPPNPFVPTPEQEAARREREAAEAAAAEAARVVYEPRKGGRPTVEHPRTKRVSLSLSDQENETLAAAAGGRRVSVWARERLLESLATDLTPGAGVEVARLRADLGRVGSNLNQLVRAVNSGQTVPSAELLAAVQATREELVRVRGELP
ncbi:plasmid mobilization protein [Glutamicibacter sp. 287]|uniref:plasmid mobilization protein n=1 Tax=Glutamicibacter TaxID=1742989 RepID=UPI003FCF8A94